MISMRWRPGLLLGLTLSGCNPVPSGQVAASVDGVEITRREVLLELEASPAPTGTSPQQAERLALEKLIDRKLLLSGARDMLIDRSPDFQIRARRGRELALVDQLVARLRAQQTQPDAAAIDRFIAAHPQIFAERRQIGSAANQGLIAFDARAFGARSQSRPPDPPEPSCSRRTKPARLGPRPG